MTPAAVLAEIPDDLIRRRANPSNQLHAVTRLAKWLSDRGHRPSLMELEQERARRATPTKETQ